MAINSVDIHLNAFANFSPVFAEVAKLKAAMAEMQSSSFGSTLSSDYVSGLQKAQQQFTNLVQSTRAFNVQSVQMADSVSQFSKQLESGQLKLGQYYNIWKQNAKGVSTELDSLATQQARVARSVVVPDALHAGYAQVITDLNGVVTTTEKAAFYQTAYNTTLRDGANKLIDFGKNMQWAGRQLTVGLTVPLGLFANQAAQAYLSFDKAMTDMLKVYGSSAVVQSQQALDTIRTQVTSLAQDLAHTIGVTMTDTVTIAQTFSQMGLTGQDLLKTTDATAKLMKIGGLTASGSAQAAIAMQNVFKLQSGQMTDAINFLNAAKHSTSTSMQDLVEAMPKVGPIITQLGGSYKDFATLIVALRENGVPASQAANTIKSMFATLVNPTTRAIKDFEGLGISLKGIVANDNGNPLKMLQDLQVALDKLPSQTRTKAIEELFGKFQFARADALISSLGKAGSQNEKVMQLYATSSSELAAVAQQEIDIASKGTPAAQYAKMKASLQADLIPVGKEFLVVLTKIGNVVDTIVKWFDKLGSFKGLLLGGLAVVGLIGPLVMFTGLFANLVGTVFKGFNYLRMFKEGFAQATDTGPLQRFAAGLKNMSNFYREVDVNALAASHSTDLMELSAQNSAKAFDVLATAIRNLTTQIAALNAVSVNPTGLAADLQSTISEAATAAKAATGAAQMELPLMLASGGYVPGMGDSDSQPALLTPGEAVIPKDKARKYAPFINAMINGTVGTFKVGRKVAETNFAHIGLTTDAEGKFGGVDYLASELLRLVSDQGVQLSAKNMAMLTQLAEKEESIMQALLVKFNGNMELAMANMPKIAALGSLGFTSGGTINQSLASGSASKAELLADWDKQGLSKWNESLVKAGLVVSDFSELTGKNASDLIALDSAIKQGIIDLPTVSKTITKNNKRITVADAVGDEDISKIYLKLQESGSQLNIAESKLIEEFNALAFTFSDFRARNLTPENMGYAGIPTETRANGDVYSRIGNEEASRSVRLPSQNNLLDKVILPDRQTVKQQMSAWRVMTESELGQTIAQIEEYLSVRFSSAVETSIATAFGAGKSAAGIASPSRLFREGIGQPITEGEAAGIRDAIPSVEAAAVASVEAASAAAKEAVQMEQPMLTGMSLINWEKERVPVVSKGNTTIEEANAWQSAGDQPMLPGMTAATGMLTPEEKAAQAAQQESAIALKKIESHTEETGKVAKESRGLGGMGKMGGMMAMSMIAPMAINALPGGTNAFKTTASNVTQFAGMGMMLGPEGAAAGAAIGGLISVMDIMKQKAKEVAAEWKANTTTSVSDLQIFKSTAMNTSITTKNLSIEHVNLSKKTKTLKGDIIDLGNGMSSTSTQVQAMVNAIKNLPKGDPLGDLVKAISDPKYKVSGVVGNLKQSVQNAISTGGLDPSQAKAYVYSALQAAGRTSDFGTAWKEISKSIGWNDKTGKSDLSKTTSSSLNALSNSKDFQTTAHTSGGKFGPGAVYQLDYSQLTGAAKAYADQLKNLYAITSNGSLSFKDMQARLNAVKSASGDTGTALDMLEKTIIGTGSKDDIARLNQVEGYIKELGPKAKLSASEIMKMNAVLQIMTPDQLKKWADANGKKLGLSAASKMADIIDAYAKSGDFKKAVDAANKAMMDGLNGGGGGGGGGGATATDWNKIYNPIIKKYQDLKNLIDNQATAQKKYNDQLKLTQDYQTKQMDYFNQAKDALTSGNYIGAAQAQQSALNNQANFAGAMKEQKASDLASNIQKYISGLQDAAANGVSLKNLSKTEGFNIPTSLSSKFTSQLLGGLSKTDWNQQTSAINAQVLAATSAAQHLASGNAFAGVTIIQNIPISNSVISPADHLAQVSAAATHAAQTAAAKTKQKSATTHKVGATGAASSRSVPKAPKPKVGG